MWQPTIWDQLKSGVTGGFWMKRTGVGCVVRPGLRCAPEASGSEIDAEGTGSTIGWEDFIEPVSQLRESYGQAMQASDGGHAGKVQSVASGVDVPVKGCGVFSSECKSG